MNFADLFDSNGRPIALGCQLGSAGAEGVVHDVSTDRELAAKVYHKSISAQKQEKLRQIVSVNGDKLKPVAAWPTATLHRGRNGPICGFLMPKAVGFRPIHELYGPTHRKQLFLKADWAFLVRAARNVAAAFDVIHWHGHVMGDVNETNLFVAQDAVVKLIDCDSFQINATGQTYRCSVSTPLFTAPELQRLQSFRGVLRTPNHDNFGLAVVCFHLLFMGRHPFAGVDRGNEDMPIPENIRDFRFAFGKDAARKLMSPPPNCPTLQLVPPQTASLFERAFSEAGSQKAIGRPKAEDWVRSLQQLEVDLKTCPLEKMHKYSKHLVACPWCALEERTGLLFFIGITTADSVGSSFMLAGIWQQIISVSSPGPAPLVGPNHFSSAITPKPIPKEIEQARTNKNILAIVVGVVALALTAVHPAYLIIGLIVATVIFFSGANDSAERQLRKTAVTNAQRDWVEAERKWNAEAGASLFESERQKLESLKSQYERLDRDFAEEKQRAHARIKERQLRRFLETFFIKHHKIPNIGPARKAKLASFGIETAADVEYKKVKDIHRFGTVYTSCLVDWRRELEMRFIFDPSKGIHPEDMAHLNQKFQMRRTEIENTLRGGQQKLTQIAAEILRKRETLHAQTTIHARALAQASADLSRMG